MGTTEDTRAAGNTPAAEPQKVRLVLLGDRAKIMGVPHGLSKQYHFEPGVAYDVAGRDATILERTGLFAKAGTPEADEAESGLAQKSTQ